MLNFNQLKLIIASYFLLALPLWAQDVDYDSDDDGLIDITTLDQLNAIRYDLNGDGTVETANQTEYGVAFPSMAGGSTYAAIICGDGSRISTCSGYELMNNLDFNDKNNDGTSDDPSKWSSDCTSGCLDGSGAETATTATVGWAPIGDDTNPFVATFNGNRYKISNLYINTTTLFYVGLFGGLGSGGEIRKLDIVGRTITVTLDLDNAEVGGLVGQNYGSISACYSAVSVEGTGDYVSVGGLVGSNFGSISACYSAVSAKVTGEEEGYVGGFVGSNNSSGSITACYATGSAEGTGEYVNVGGLVGINHGEISACYSTGSAMGGDDADVGGLVGSNSNSGRISACYSTGSAIGGSSASIGGLVGAVPPAVVPTNSYFDTTTSSLVNGVGRFLGGAAVSNNLGKTTAQLQYPTDYTEADAASSGVAIYSAWNVDVDGATTTATNEIVWDFGTASQHPKLQVDFDGDGNATVAEFGSQRPGLIQAPAPMSLAVGTVTDVSVTLSWASYSAAHDGFKVYYSETPDFDPSSDGTEFMSSPGPNATGVVVVGLTANTTYYFRVAAASGVAVGIYTSALMTTTLAAPQISFAFADGTATDGASNSSPVDVLLNVTGAGFGSDTGITITVAATMGTSIANGDYTLAVKSGSATLRGSYPTHTLSVPATTMSVMLTFTADDTDNEGEVVTLTLSNSSAPATIGTTNVHIIPITDEDVPVLDYDSDDDGLIDITMLAQLDAIRYDLDGDGAVVTANEANYGAAFPAMTGGSAYAAIDCGGGSGCIGYELMNNIDFDDTDSGTGDKQLSKWSKYAGDPSAYPGGVTATFSGTPVPSGWVPIGDNSSKFTAIFDGNGRTISNLYVNTSTLSRVGLLGSVGSDGKIRRLGIEGGSVTGTVTNSRVGGLVGQNFGSISACYSAVSVERTGEFADVGGLVGQNSGSISACYSTGSVTRVAFADVGGLVGQNSGSISACYSAVSVEGTGDNAIMGGLVGRNSESITACYSTGSVTGGNRSDIGGLVGRNSKSITACYSTGSVTGGSSASVGGLVGQNLSGAATANSYFDKTTAILTLNMVVQDGSSGKKILGIGNKDNATSEDLGKTTAQLQYPTTYTEADAASGGMAIYSTWNVDVSGTTTVDANEIVWAFGANNRYPKLKVDFDGDAAPTAVEFGRRLYFTNTADVEVFSFSVRESTTSGTEIGSLKLLSGMLHSASLSGNNHTNFTIDAMGQITVSAGVTLSLSAPMYMLRVTVIDGAGNVAATDFSITVVDRTPPSFTFPLGMSSFAFEIAENALTGKIGTIVATDNGGGALTYILTGSADFNINASNGQITASFGVTFSLSAPMYAMRVTVRDGAGNVAATDFSITVVDRTPPSFTFPLGMSSFAFRVAENALTSVAVGTITAADNGSVALTYSLTGDNHTDFTIDAMGQITVSSGSTLSFATKPRYMLSVTVTDGGSNAVIASVSIAVLDKTFPSFTFPAGASSFAFEVADGSAADTVVGRIVATDNGGGALIYRLAGDDHTDFTIDTMGQITVSSVATLSLSAPRYMLSVAVTDGASNAVIASVNITVVDETPPSFTFSAGESSFAFEVAENILAGAVVGTIDATDNGGGALTYSLTGDGHADFTIDAMGQITVSSGVSLSFATRPTYNLMVRATDAAMNEASAAVTIIVISGLPPRFTFPSGASSFAFKVAENALPAGVVGIITATGDVLTYSLAGDDHTDFTIDSVGVVKVSDPANLDRAAKPSYMLSVTVRDRRDNAITAEVNITVAEIDTTPPRFTFPSGEISFVFGIADGSVAATVVGTITATDDVSSTLTYSLAGNNHTDFTIDAMGAITVSTGVTLSLATRPRYALRVKATDGAGNVSLPANVTITVIDLAVFGVAAEKARVLGLYPNPASDKVYVSGLEPRSRYLYELYSLWGERVSTGQLSEARSIDLEEISVGIYVLVLRSEDGEELLRSRCLVK